MDGAVSVIVPFRDSGRYFRTMLASIAAQETDTPLEVVLVDNGSADDSRSIAEEFARHEHFQVVDAPLRASSSYARNVGAAAASSDKLLFVDADDELAPGYVKALADALDDHEFVTAQFDCSALNPPWLRMAHGKWWRDNDVPVLLGFLPSAGASVGIRRRLFESIGGYPEVLPVGVDLALSWSAQLAGARLHFVGEAVYRYRYRDTLRGLYLQTREWGKVNVLLFAKFRHAGMPGRPVREAVREWASVCLGLLRERTPAEQAALIVRLGHCVGRLMGSLKYRTLYL